MKNILSFFFLICSVSIIAQTTNDHELVQKCWTSDDGTQQVSFVQADIHIEGRPEKVIRYAWTADDQPYPIPPDGTVSFGFCQPAPPEEIKCEYKILERCDSTNQSFYTLIKIEDDQTTTINHFTKDNENYTPVGNYQEGLCKEDCLQSDEYLCAEFITDEPCAIESSRFEMGVAGESIITVQESNLSFTLTFSNAVNANSLLQIFDNCLSNSGIISFKAATNLGGAILSFGGESMLNYNYDQINRIITLDQTDTELYLCDEIYTVERPAIEYKIQSVEGFCYSRKLYVEVKEKYHKITKCSGVTYINIEDPENLDTLAARPTDIVDCDQEEAIIPIDCINDVKHLCGQDTTVLSIEECNLIVNENVSSASPIASISRSANTYIFVASPQPAGIQLFDAAATCLDAGNIFAFTFDGFTAVLGGNGQLSYLKNQASRTIVVDMDFSAEDPCDEYYPGNTLPDGSGQVSISTYQYFCFEPTPEEIEITVVQNKYKEIITCQRGAFYVHNTTFDTTSVRPNDIVSCDTSGLDNTPILNELDSLHFELDSIQLDFDTLKMCLDSLLKNNHLIRECYEINFPPEGCRDYKVYYPEGDFPISNPVFDGAQLPLNGPYAFSLQEMNRLITDLENYFDNNGWYYNSIGVDSITYGMEISLNCFDIDHYFQNTKSFPILETLVSDTAACWEVYTYIPSGELAAVSFNNSDTLSFDLPPAEAKKVKCDKSTISTSDTEQITTLDTTHQVQYIDICFSEGLGQDTLPGYHVLHTLNGQMVNKYIVDISLDTIVGAEPVPCPINCNTYYLNDIYCIELDGKTIRVQTKIEDCEGVQTSSLVNTANAQTVILDTLCVPSTDYETFDVDCFWEMELLNPNDGSETVIVELRDNQTIHYRTALCRVTSCNGIEEEKIARGLLIAENRVSMVLSQTLDDGGWVDSIMLTSNLSGNFWVPLSPFTATLSGCAGAVASTDLFFDIANPSILESALEIVLKNYLCTLGYSDGVDYNLSFLQVSGSSDGSVSLGFRVKHNPSGDWVGFENGVGQMHYHIDEDTEIVSVVQGTALGGGPITCEYETPCGELYLRTRKLEPFEIDINQTTYNNIVLSAESYTYELAVASVPILQCPTQVLTSNADCGTGTVDTIIWSNGAIGDTIAWDGTGFQPTAEVICNCDLELEICCDDCGPRESILPTVNCGGGNEETYCCNYQIAGIPDGTLCAGGTANTLYVIGANGQLFQDSILIANPSLGIFLKNNIESTLGIQVNTIDENITINACAPIISLEFSEVCPQPEPDPDNYSTASLPYEQVPNTCDTISAGNYQGNYMYQSPCHVYNTNDQGAQSILSQILIALNTPTTPVVDYQIAYRTICAGDSTISVREFWQDNVIQYYEYIYKGQNTTEPTDYNEGPCVQKIPVDSVSTACNPLSTFTFENINNSTISRILIDGISYGPTDVNPSSTSWTFFGTNPCGNTNVAVSEQNCGVQATLIFVTGQDQITFSQSGVPTTQNTATLTIDCIRANSISIIDGLDREFVGTKTISPCDTSPKELAAKYYNVQQGCNNQGGAETFIMPIKTQSCFDTADSTNIEGYIYEFFSGNQVVHTYAQDIEGTKYQEGDFNQVRCSCEPPEPVYPDPTHFLLPYGQFTLGTESKWTQSGFNILAADSGCTTGAPYQLCYTANVWVDGIQYTGQKTCTVAPTTPEDLLQIQIDALLSANAPSANWSILGTGTNAQIRSEFDHSKDFAWTISEELNNCDTGQSGTWGVEVTVDENIIVDCIFVGSSAPPLTGSCFNAQPSQFGTL